MQEEEVKKETGVAAKYEGYLFQGRARGETFKGVHCGIV